MGKRGIRVRLKRSKKRRERKGRKNINDNNQIRLLANRDLMSLYLTR